MTIKTVLKEIAKKGFVETRVVEVDDFNVKVSGLFLKPLQFFQDHPRGLMPKFRITKIKGEI